MKIPIAKTVFTEDEYENILKPLRTGWIVQGPFVEEFEGKWSEFTEAKNSIATTSCTTALHLCLAALGIKTGDEVIVPSFTWVATANVVECIGAIPVFADIDLKTFNIETSQLEHLITNKTKAIIPVHLFGLAANLYEVMEFATKNNLKVIEDAACGFASKYNNKHVGNFGNAGCFSFHPRKAITTGEGGMITTNDDSFAAKLRSMRDHGASLSDHQRHLGNKPYLLSDFPYLGFNYRMTDIQASIGTTQMNRAKDIASARRNIAEIYDKFIESISWLDKPFTDKNYQHGYQAYVCVFEPEKITIDNVDKINSMRNAFMDYLQSNGISTRPGTHAVHMLDYYKTKYKLTDKDFPNAMIADRCSIALPIFPSMTGEEINFIKQKISDYKI